MNIMGKILVILNLLFALAVGGFLIVDFATRTNWRDGYLKLKREIDIAAANGDAVTETMRKANNDNRKLTQERDSARREVIAEKEEKAALSTVFETKLKDAELRVADADLRATKFLAEKELLTKESENRLKIIKLREDEIIKLTEERRKFRDAAVAEEGARRAAEDRLTQQLTRVAELERELIKRSGGSGTTEPVVLRGKANPPMVYVEGKIEEVDQKRPELVQISVGSDKGLTTNHTLEVFRVDAASPTYVGMIRIVSVNPHKAVGRVESYGPTKTALRVGDTVASSLTRN